MKVHAFFAKVVPLYTGRSTICRIQIDTDGQYLDRILGFRFQGEKRSPIAETTLSVHLSVCLCHRFFRSVRFRIHSSNTIVFYKITSLSGPRGTPCTRQNMYKNKMTCRKTCSIACGSPPPSRAARAPASTARMQKGAAKHSRRSHGDHACIACKFIKNICEKHTTLVRNNVSLNK